MNTLNSRKTLLAVAIATLFLIAGCSDKKPTASKHDHGAGPVASASDHHDEAGEKLTDFSAKTELFVEFPALVVGQSATFAAHLTQLDDFKPLDKGQVTIVLSGGNDPEERFTAEVSAVPGIFKPVATPKVAGERELAVVVDSPLGPLTHELGPVKVYPDAKAAASSHGAHEHGDEGIAFSKEQQWKIDFATVEVIKGKVRPSVVATASIKAQPDGEAHLAAPAAGIVRTAGSFPHVGQFVKNGQLLATLTPRLGGETDQASLDAGASKARITLEQARRERERMEALFKDEAIPEKRLLEARANEKLAQTDLDAAQARAAQLSGGAGIAIRSPINGTIADVSVASGAYVAEGIPLFHVANTGLLWLDARVPESDISRLGTPTAVDFSVAGFDHTFKIDGKNGRLIAVGGVVDSATRTVPVIFEFNNSAKPANALRLGMIAKAQIYAGATKDALLVPASAIQDESGTQVVYVQTGGESFERKIVQTGARDGDQIAIVSGLEPGQRVVSKGAYLIRLSTSKTGPSGHTH
ncbi:MAG: efflux RND transporter periplasmic adaptor subunit [Gallionellaceae bacterium]|nr:efflux RND transporter periplasmic adaptor subunit [Gallionellaceae bacterium]